MDFFHESFQPYNGVFTLLVLTCFGYWILVIAGFFGVEVWDFEVEMDGDVGFETELDADVGGDHADAADLGSVGLIGGFLRFMHLHEVPFMIVLTIFSTTSWLLFTLLNLNWNVEHSWTFALIWLGPTILAALAISKVLLQPFAYLFRQVNIPEKRLKDFVGECCVVMTSEVTNKFGQGEIATNESPLVVQIRNTTPFRFHKGDRAVLTRYNAAGKYYEIGPVTKKDTE